MSSGRSANNTPVGTQLPSWSSNKAQQQRPQHGSISGSGSSEPAIKPHGKIPNILPHERVFPIQIGSELFKLSGASLSSDAPSYFSQYFLCQIAQAQENGTDPGAAIRTLYIDRDPLTFRDISLHLQGYHVSPRDGTHFVRLFADAQFYSLPKLISQLYEESIFMSIGHREFQIPRDLFSDPGNSPNFFSLGFAIFFSSPTELFPGLDREGLIRPPSILPPSVPGRSADTFAELLHLLRGYPLRIRDDEHRASLLRDCRYFNFKGVEQRLIPHSRGFNQLRGRDEIVLRLEDILKSGISVAPPETPPPISHTNHTAAAAGLEPQQPVAAWMINYARPFVDDKPAELVLEVGGENARLHFQQGNPAAACTRVEFFRDARARVTKLFEVIAAKLNLAPAAQAAAGPGSTPLSDGEDWVRCVIEPEAGITLDGARYTGHNTEADAGDEMIEMPTAVPGVDAPAGVLSGLSLNPARKRRRLGGAGLGFGAQGGYWVLRTSQWRLRIEPAKSGRRGVECVFSAVKLDAMSGEHARNEARGFLRG